MEHNLKALSLRDVEEEEMEGSSQDEGYMEEDRVSDYHDNHHTPPQHSTVDMSWLYYREGSRFINVESLHPSDDQNR